MLQVKQQFLLFLFFLKKNSHAKRQPVYSPDSQHRSSLSIAARNCISVSRVGIVRTISSNGASRAAIANDDDDDADVDVDDEDIVADVIMTRHSTSNALMAALSDSATLARMTFWLAVRRNSMLPNLSATRRSAVFWRRSPSSLMRPVSTKSVRNHVPSIALCQP